MALTKIKGTGIANLAVDTEHIAASAVETAKINNDAVSLDKMASGTDGAMLTYDASGNPVAITGTDGQVATSAGANAVSAFEAVPSFDADAAQVFNESGAAVESRIESDDDANIFFVDGSEDAVGIGTNAPKTQAGRTGLTISGSSGGALWLRDNADTDSWKIEGSDSVLNIGIDTNDDGAANSQYAKIYPDGKFQLGSVLQFAEVNRTESSSVSSGTWVTMYEAPADGTFISIAWGVNSDKYSVDLWSAVDSRGTHLGPQDMGNSNGFGRRWNGNSLQTYHTSGQNRAIRSVVYRWALPSTANP